MKTKRAHMPVQELPTCPTKNKNALEMADIGQELDLMARTALQARFSTSGIPVFPTSHGSYIYAQ